VHHIVVNRPWPGSGAATAILSRAKGRGRIQEVTALTDLATTPGQDLTIQLPNIPEQTGVVSSVVFSTTDTMDVGSRALYEEAS
jgi:hypothetical protein